MAKARKFGVFGGVFTPSILTILGVIMFLRLPWIVGQAGLWSTLGIILVAHIISMSTGLSVASVATDKRVGTGGSYFIISRSLGLPIGGTLGIALFVGLSFSVSLYLIGFAETFLSYFGFEVGLASIRIAGSIILFLVAVVTFISTSLAIKTQYLIMTAMVLSLVSVFLGRHGFGPAEPLLLPMGGALPWIALFAIFFPAVTGFEAGVSMSGDLKDPRKNIPVGTISAILVGLLVYVGLAFFFSYTVDRNLLVGDSRVLFNISLVPQLVIAGILGATLSSALGSILGAPRILQAVAADRILPAFFAKGFGASHEPRNALMLTYMIAQAGILIGELNAIARIVTIFFIITYGFLNITYALESWAGTDFRPSFKIPRVVSIIGALACIVVMIQLDVIALIVASVALIALFLFLKRRELTLQTGDTWNSIWASLVKTGLGRLTTSGRRVNNWRPNVILFSGGEMNRPHLVDMGKSLVGKLGIFTNFELVENPSSTTPFKRSMEPEAGIQRGKPGVFTRYHECRDVYEGMATISKVYGFSGFEPNTVLMGWARNTRHPQKFAALLKDFKAQNLNTVFLHYDKTNGFGNYRTIDVWWSGRGRNLSLAIALLRFITSSKEWRTAGIRILTITSSSSQTESLHSLVNQVLDNQRMRARVKVISNGVEQLPEADIIHAESRTADLCLLELPEFGKQEPVRPIEQINQLVAQLRTSLVISASDFFDEISVKSPAGKGSGKQLPVPVKKPAGGILGQLENSSLEIVANEVYNLGKASETAVNNFEEGRLHPMMEKSAGFFPELAFLSGKMLDNLARALDIPRPEDRSKALLRLLNDFSFHSQKQIQVYKEQIMPFHREALEAGLSSLLSGLKMALAEAPEKLWIKRHRREFVIHKEDPLTARLYKLRKILAATLTGRPVPHRVRLLPAARYYVYYKRLEALRALMNDFALHSFRQMAEIRKVLTSIHEAIEKARLETADQARLTDSVRLEKDRLKAQVELLADEDRAFHEQAGARLYLTLLDDLNSLARHLESTRANLLSRHFKVWFKREEEAIAGLQAFPAIWEKNLGLSANRALLDFSVLSLQSRINSKIGKYHQEFALILEGGLLQWLGTCRKLLGSETASLKESVRGFQRLDQPELTVPQVNEHYETLFDEIRDLLREVPEKFDIGDSQFAEHAGSEGFEEAEPLTVNLRKALSLYVGSEFIDPANKKTLEAERELQKHVVAIRDLMRLMSFSLTTEEGIDDDQDKTRKEEQLAVLMNNFHDKLNQEEQQLRAIRSGLEKAFSDYLKESFEPLSSATIGKTSRELRKRRRGTKGGSLGSGLREHLQQASNVLQQQFVNLLYSKSEGLIWFSHLEKSGQAGLLSNRDTLGFVEAITPDPEVVRDLPFYYCTLFSGQAGIGDDFWVGMKHQITEADEAIRRFKQGVPGALVVTGARSSGKSSLSKMMARKHFTTDNIHQVRAPQGCTADPELFSSKLLEALNAHNKSVNDVFRALPSGKVVLVQDLALWWERRPGGDAVIELLKSLIDRFGHKCLFIITVNSHALPLIDHWSGLKGYALATVSCEPFDARELKEMILLRHHAGGLSLQYGGKPDDRLTAWDYARLFSRLFDSSYGNPGTAIALWLASIKKVTGKTIHLDSLELPSTEVFDKLSRDQWFYVLQFILHRRFTTERLAANIEQPREQVYQGIRELVRAGILVEKFEGIYAIRPGLDLYLTDKLKSMNRL